MPSATPQGYEKKFVEFIRMCRDAHGSGLKQIVVASPSAIENNYHEIIESLSRLAESSLSPPFAGPDTGWPHVSRN